jgi:hypothetical protein
MKKLLLLILILFIIVTNIQSQGCVAIRSTGAICTKTEAGADDHKSWQLNTSYRYFRSHRHFVGTEEQKERHEQNTEVINWQHAMNFTLVRNLNARWSLALDVPIISNKRSSLYEHGGNSGGQAARHNTRSFGLGDIRISAYRWLIDPMKSFKGNIQAGLGLKLPTGDYQYQDFFIKADGSKVLGPIDQSIQLGDGGTGFTAEVNAYYNFTKNIGVYGNFFYLLNPREQNGVSTARGGTPSATALTYNTSTMSVPDQYMARGGANFSHKALTLSAGIRMECVPSSDLIGGDGGFRRPGYVLSFEPGLAFSTKTVTAFATVPVAFERNRTQSNGDKLRTAATGIHAQGDAAFADYAINVGLSFHF